MFVRTLSVIVLLAVAFPALGQDEANKPNTNWPGYQEGDYVIHDYKFASGESLPEVKLHYRTIGTAKTERGWRGGQRRAAVAGQHRYRRQLVSADAG